MADLGHKSQEGAEDWERREPPICPEAGPHTSGKAPQAGQPPFLRGLFPKALDTSVLIFSNHRPSLQVPAGQKEGPHSVGVTAEEKGLAALKAVRAGAGARKVHYLQCRVPEGKGTYASSLLPGYPTPDSFFGRCAHVCANTGDKYTCL